MVVYDLLCSWRNTFFGLFELCFLLNASANLYILYDSGVCFFEKPRKPRVTFKNWFCFFESLGLDTWIIRFFAAFLVIQASRSRPIHENGTLDTWITLRNLKVKRNPSRIQVPGPSPPRNQQTKACQNDHGFGCLRRLVFDSFE